LQPLTDRIDLLRSQLATMKIATRREFVLPGNGNSPIVGGDCGPASATVVASRASPVGTADVRSGLADAEMRALSAMNETIRTARLEQTLANLEAIGNHLSAIPGRKSLVWITSGMPIVLMPTQSQSLVSYEAQIRQAAQRLANQGIAVYPVDAKGGCRAFDKTQNQGPYGFQDAPEHVFASLGAVADVTGGRFIKYQNDPTQAVAVAAADQRGTYTIGFYAADEPATADDEWRRLKVAVKRRGVDLRYRQGYLATRHAQPPPWTSNSWNSVAYQPLDSTDIRLNARGETSGSELVVSLQIAADDLYFEERNGKVIADLDIGLVEKTPKGPTNVRQQEMVVTLQDPARDQRSQLIPMKTAWPLNPATSAVRVIIRDRLTGRYGTLEMPISRIQQ
jgi:VWFA-related protein